MKKRLLFSALVLLSLASCSEGQKIEHDVIKNEIRPPAYPLITIDPYTSGWSFTDNLYDGVLRHWTGKDFPLLGVIKVDNQFYRFMGEEALELLPIAIMGEQGEWIGNYVTEKPKGDWMSSSFDASTWKHGVGAFGTMESEPTSRTEWGTEFIWVRRTFDLKEDCTSKNIFLEYSHDDDAIIYVNGVEVVNTGNFALKNKLTLLPPEVVETMKKGSQVTIAAYCHNRVGNGLIDFGLFVEKDNSIFFPQTAIQKSVDVQATQTHYAFQAGNVDLNVTFTAPLLMRNLDLMSRPINYISYNIVSNDGKVHDVELYIEASPLWDVDKPLQESTCDIIEQDGLVYLRTGSISQHILGKSGDDVRIDWGHFYLVGDQSNSLVGATDNMKLRSNFIDGTFQKQLDKDGKYNHLGLLQKMGSVKEATGKVMLGYDDVFSVQYFGENLRPYWNRKSTENILTQFVKANKEYSALMKQCYDFDKQLMLDGTRVGGKEYAELCALAYRQSISAHKLAEAPNGDLLFLSKENFSNGSIGTVDVTYPSAPLYLYYNPELAKGLLNHIFFYSESGKWKKPFAAHDIGTYPLANGQTYGGDMPVEESGNMLVLAGLISEVEGNANYAEKHWETLTVWTDYLVEYGLDPENQLCTDDFAGHFAHNANLSIKAIMGIAFYGRMADMLGKDEVSQKYIGIAKEMARKWEQMASDGDHYKLTFDKAGTWSQKYNMVWNKVLGMDIFDDKIAKTEIPYYLSKQNVYGLPLDSREPYTKTDWIMWTATMADDKETFEAFISPIHKFMNETTDRVPMSDWVFTDRPNLRGFQARSVVGGYYIKMLEEKLNRK